MDEQLKEFLEEQRIVSQEQAALLASARAALEKAITIKGGSKEKQSPQG